MKPLVYTDFASLLEIWDRLSKEEHTNTYSGKIGVVHDIVNANLQPPNDSIDGGRLSPWRKAQNLQRLSFCMDLVDAIHADLSQRETLIGMESAMRMLGMLVRFIYTTINQFLTGGISQDEQKEWRPHVDRALAWLSNRDYVEKFEHVLKQKHSKIFTEFLESYHRALEWFEEFPRFRENPPIFFIDAVIVTDNLESLSKQLRVSSTKGFFPVVIRRLLYAIKLDSDLDAQEKDPPILPVVASKMCHTYATRSRWIPILMQMLDAGQLDNNFNFTAPYPIFRPTPHIDDAVVQLKTALLAMHLCENYLSKESVENAIKLLTPEA